MNALIPKSALALMPKIVTKRDIIRGVPDRYRDQYPDPDYSVTQGRCGDTQEALDLLDLETATPDDVAKIIGNDSWTTNECGICQQDRDAVVVVFREYESEISVCGLCAAEISGMLALASPPIEGAGK